MLHSGLSPSFVRRVYLDRAAHLQYLVLNGGDGDAQIMSIVRCGLVKKLSLRDTACTTLPDDVASAVEEMISVATFTSKRLRRVLESKLTQVRCLTFHEHENHGVNGVDWTSVTCAICDCIGNMPRLETIGLGTRRANKFVPVDTISAQLATIGFYPSKRMFEEGMFRFRVEPR